MFDLKIVFNWTEVIYICDNLKKSKAVKLIHFSSSEWEKSHSPGGQSLPNQENEQRKRTGVIATIIYDTNRYGGSFHGRLVLSIEFTRNREMIEL